MRPEINVIIDDMIDGKDKSNFSQFLQNWLNKKINFELKSLTDLKITGQFDHPIDNLPPNLKYLQVGFYFNQPIYNLPVNLKMFDISCFSYDYQNLIDKNILEKFNVQKKELKTILVNKTF